MVILVYLGSRFFHNGLAIFCFIPYLTVLSFLPFFPCLYFWKDIAAYRAKGKPDAAKKGVVKAEKSKKKKEEEEDEEDEEDEEEEEDEEDEEEEEDDDDE